MCKFCHAKVLVNFNLTVQFIRNSSLDLDTLFAVVAIFIKLLRRKILCRYFTNEQCFSQKWKMFLQLMWWHSEYFHPVQDLTKCTEQSSMQSCCFHDSTEHQKYFWPLPDHSPVACSFFEKPCH